MYPRWKSIQREQRDFPDRERLKPFIDASCRREPDFESKYPSVTSLCRPSFARNLCKDDAIVYMTVRQAPYGSTDPQWFLVAILQVMERYKSHEAAAAWYTERGLALPKNCIVDGNDAVGWQKTSQSVMVQNPKSKGKISVQRIEQDFDKWSDIEKVRYWDAEYKKRFEALDSGGDYKNRSFGVCKSLYMNLDSPQIITEKVCQAVWRKPKPKLTQTAVKLTKSEFQEMLAKMAIFIEAL